MQLWVSEENIPFFAALASPIRIKILERLAKSDANIKELAEDVGVTSAMMTSHIRKLEEVGLVATSRSKKNGKVCALINQWYILRLPLDTYQQLQDYDLQLGVGQYVRADVTLTCGLADAEKLLCEYDIPKYFHDPDHFNAQLIWFTSGYVEYEIPSYVPKDCKIMEIEISAEMCSEYPLVREDWESDINLYLNGELICPWVSPGDFGLRRGKYTPRWFPSNQYGLLKRYEINRSGTFLDKEPQSDKTVDDFHLDREVWTLRFEASGEKRRPGGLTIFGEQYGDYPVGIQVRVIYERPFMTEKDKKDSLYLQQPASRWGKMFAENGEEKQN